MSNQIENSSYLKAMNESLLEDIKAIINKNFDNKVKASNGIMERLRGETIFIPKSHKKELKKKQLEDKKYPVTIDPDRCLPISLTQIENGSIDTSGLDLIKQGIIQIKANSVGPYFPEAYFNNDTKILWILKESFIEGPSYLAGDRGGHNQAAEYGYYFSQYGNLGSYEETHPRVLELTKRMLISLGELSIDKKTNERDVTKEVMNHICILEANHFPGLAYNSKKSDDDLIGDWTGIHKDLLQELIHFYDPDIVVGGGDYILNHLCNGVIFNWCAEFEYEKIQEESKNPQEDKYKEYRPLKVANEIIDYSWKRVTIKNHCLIRTVKNIKSTNKLNRYWINTYHPQQFRKDFQNTLEQDISLYSKTIYDDLSQKKIW